VKISNFGREYPGIKFPEFRTLSAIDAKKIVTVFTNKLGLGNISPLELVNVLRANSRRLSKEDAEDESFELDQVLLRNGIFPKENVFINWYRYDQIDEIALKDLSSHFDDIWYAGVDDLDISDESFSWIVSIGYSGEVLITHLN